MICIHSNAEKSFSLNPFNELEFKNTISELPNADNVPKGECHVLLTIDYTNHRFNVKFPKKSPSGGNFNEIRMTFSPIDRPFINQSVRMTVIYSCYTGVDCNRNYLLKYFSSMIAMNYSEIQEELFSIFTVEQKGKLSCYLNTEVSKKCSVPLCVAIEIEDGQFEARCGNDKNNVTEFNLIVQEKKDGVEKSIKYVCNFDHCNDENTFQNARRAVEFYHEDLLEFLDLPIKVTRRSTMETFTKSNSPTTKRINNAIIQTKTSILFIISMLFISFFLLK
jgi:hypothetical protein